MIDRRTFMALMAAAATSPATAQNSQAFSRDWLINLAKEKAQTPSGKAKGDHSNSTCSRRVFSLSVQLPCT